MSIQEFELLPCRHQRTFALMRGHYLATRWQAPDETMKLFQLPEGFFIKLTFTPNAHGAQHLFAFESGSKEVLNYAMLVQLPGWMPDADS